MGSYKTHGLKNLSAIKTLNNRTDIIVINADKGGTVTILNLNDNINDANKPTNDPLHYKELVYDANTINYMIEAFKIKQKIPASIADGFKSIRPKTPQLRLYHQKSYNNAFLNHLDKVPATESSTSYLVTLDVKSLYSNITNDEGIEIVKAPLQKAGNKVTLVIVALLWAILTLSLSMENITSNYLVWQWEQRWELCTTYRRVSRVWRP